MEKKFLINRVLKPHWKVLTVALFAVAVEGGAGLLDPWPIKIVLDYVIGSRQPPEWMSNILTLTFGQNPKGILNFAVVAVVAIAVLGAVASYTENYLTTKVGQLVMYDLRRTLYHHIQRLSLSYHDRQKTADLTGRVTSDIDAIQSFISSALLGILVDILTLVGMLAVMFFLNWRFTLLAMSVTPVLFFEVYTLTRRTKQATRAVRKKESAIVTLVQESLSSIRIVKAFAREEYEERRLDKVTVESIDMALQARAIKARLAPIVDCIVAVGTGIVLWYGARLVLTGQLTSGALVVFLLYLGKMYKPMRDLSKMTDTISKAQVGAERIREVIQTESQVRDLRGARRAPRFKGDIQFEHVSFGYNKEQSVLKDVNLSIKAGQTVALVGPTGSGKSTLVSLLPRFYDPDSGSIRIDGKDVRDFTLRSLRQQFGFVLQDTLLFNASIWQNIAYGKPEAKRDEIIRAAKLANVEEFVQKMPEGYNTNVGERGATLSGGQRQRLAIARAIIRDSPIIILDEPTTGLDAASEELVMEALDRLLEGKTSIMIAHKLATIKKADIIFVLKDGTVAERGTHEELLGGGGLYAELYGIQSQDEAEPVFS